MRTRASAPQVVCVVAVALAPLLTGCAGKFRPDAEAARAHVALSVERQERRLVESLTILASAEEGAAVIDAQLEERAEVEAGPAHDVPTRAGAPPAGGGHSGWLESSVPSFSFATAKHPYGAEAADAAGRPREAEGRQGLPNLRFQLLKFDIKGRPVDLKCTIRDKRLVFGAKIQM